MTLKIEGTVERKSFDLGSMEGLLNDLDAGQLIALANIVRNQDRLAVGTNGKPIFDEIEIDVIGQFVALDASDSDDDESDEVGDDEDIDSPPIEPAPELAGLSAEEIADLHPELASDSNDVSEFVAHDAAASLPGFTRVDTVTELPRD
jgi:hypothetical protein